MSISSRRPPQRSTERSARLSGQRRMLHRFWPTPRTSSRLFWLLLSAILYLALLVVYIYAARTQSPLLSARDPLRFFGVIAYLLLLITASYTLRRRMLRRLSGRVQSWLWMHTWLGILTLLVALLHANLLFVTHGYCLSARCLTASYGGGGALLALILLVVTGLLGRGLDYWQCRVIADDAATNGYGLAESLRAQMRRYEYLLERYCAGKSAAFKWACSEALAARGQLGRLDDKDIAADEEKDWLHVCHLLMTYAQLAASLQRQLRAQCIMRVWRIVHSIVATCALIVITYHAAMELLTNVFHLLPLGIR